MRFIIFFLICFQIVFGKPTKRRHIHGEENDKYIAHNHKEWMKELAAEQEAEKHGVPGTIVEGDIIASKKFLKLRHKNESNLRDVVIYPGFTWNTNAIPFVFSKNLPDMYKDMIKSGMQDFEKYTCIRFVPRTIQPDYINFDFKGQCSSFLGKHGGKQELNIGPACALKGTALHEMMHALGFVHEHTRLDRDKYVKVNLENIAPGDREEFDKYQAGVAANIGKDYDFASIMHYGMLAFSMNGKPSIEPLDTKVDASVIGQRSGFSDLDIIELNEAFKCNGNPSESNAGLTSQSSLVASNVKKEITPKAAKVSPRLLIKKIVMRSTT